LRCSHERQHDGRQGAPAACILVGIGQPRQAQLAVMLLDLVTLPGRDPVTFVDEISAVSAPRVEISCGWIWCVDLRDSALLSRGRGPAPVSTSPPFRRASLATAARFWWLQRLRFAPWGCNRSVSNVMWIIREGTARESFEYVPG